MNDGKNTDGVKEIVEQSVFRDEANGWLSFGLPRIDQESHSQRLF